MSKKTETITHKITISIFFVLILGIGMPVFEMPFAVAGIASDYAIVNFFLGNGLVGKPLTDNLPSMFVSFNEVPTALAQEPSYPVITRGSNFQTIQLDKHNFTTALGLPEYIERFDGVFIPYEYWEGANHVTFNSAELSFVFDKSACAYTIYNDGRIFTNATEIIKSDTWIVKYAENGTDNWQDVPQQSLGCSSEIIEFDDDTFQIQYTKTDSLGTINHIMNKSVTIGMKHIVSYTNDNPAWNNTKIGFSHILQGTPENLSITTIENSTEYDTLYLNTNSSAITNDFGNATQYTNDINISHDDLLFNSTAMIKDGFNFHFTDDTKQPLHYDFDQGLDKLWNMRYMEEDGITKLYLDYMNEPSILGIGETVTIDPIFSASGSSAVVNRISIVGTQNTVAINGHNGCGNNGLGCAVAGLDSSFQVRSVDNQVWIPFITYDISSIPSNADVQEVKLGHSFSTFYATISRPSRSIDHFSLNGEDFESLSAQALTDCLYHTTAGGVPHAETNPFVQGAPVPPLPSAPSQEDSRIGDGNPTSNPCGMKHIDTTDSPTAPVDGKAGSLVSGNDVTTHDDTGDLSNDLEDRFLSLGLTKYTYLLCDFDFGRQIADITTVGIMGCAGNIGQGVIDQGSLAVSAGTDNLSGFSNKDFSGSISQGSVNTFLNVTYVVLTQPSAPLVLTCNPTSPTSVDLDWFPPVDLGGAQFISGYNIQRDSGGGFTDLIANSGSSITFATDSTVTAGITFTYRVAGITQFGLGEFSSEVNCGVAGVSNNVFDLQATSQALGVVALDWTEPTFTGNTIITGYTIQRTTGTPQDAGNDWQSIKHGRTTALQDGTQIILNVGDDTSACTQGEPLERSDDGVTTFTDVTVEGLCISTDSDAGATNVGHSYLFKSFPIEDIKGRNINILWEQFRNQQGSGVIGSPAPNNQCTNLNTPSPCDKMNFKWYIVDGEFSMEGANVIESGGDFEALIAGTHTTGELHIPPVGNGIVYDCLDVANNIVNIAPATIATNPDEHVTQIFPLLSFINQQGVHDITCQVDDLSGASQDKVTIVFVMYDDQGGSIQFSPFGANAARFSTGIGAVVIDFIDVEGIGFWDFNDDLPTPTSFDYGHRNQHETTLVYNQNVGTPTILTAAHLFIEGSPYVNRGIEIKTGSGAIGVKVLHMSVDLTQSGNPVGTGQGVIYRCTVLSPDPSTCSRVAETNTIDVSILGGGYVTHHFEFDNAVTLQAGDRIVFEYDQDANGGNGVGSVLMKANPNTANSPFQPTGYGASWLNQDSNTWAILSGQNNGGYATDMGFSTSYSSSITFGANLGVNSMALVNSGDFAVGQGWITLEEDTGNTNTEYLDTTVLEQVSYGYRVFTLNDQGSSGASNVAIVVTAGSPEAPVITSTPLGTTSISVDWETPELSGGSLVVYEIERKLGTAGIFSFIDTTTDTDFNDGSGLFALQSATEYCYQIKTITNVGESPFSNETCSTTFDAPTEVENLVVTALDGSTAEMSFDDPLSDGGSALTGFQIDLKIGAGAFSEVQASNSLNRERNDTGLPIGTLITYRVTPFNQFGAGDVISASDTTDATPQAPQNFVCSASSSTSITLNWETPDTFSAPTGYLIDRKTVGGSFSTLVANTADTSTVFVNDGLVVDSVFVYRVLGHTTEGDTDFSSEVTCTTLGAPDTPPEDFQGDFTSTIPHQMVLAWDIPDTLGIPITSFRIERDDGAGYNQIGSVSGSSFLFIDVNPSDSVSQKYRVFTVGSLGDSAPSIAVPFSANQVSHWHYDKTIDDTGDNKNSGLITGTANFDNAGINGNGLLFDGSTYITVNDEADYDFDNSNSFGITTYYRGNSTGVDQVLIGKAGTMSDTGFRMFIDDTGVLGIRLTNTATSNELHILGNTNVTDNSIHFLGIGYDGNDDESGLSLMVDGVFETKNVIANTLSGSILNNKPLVIGANDGGGNKLTGLLDDTRFFGSGTLDDATLEAVANNNINTVIPINATITIGGSTFADISRETPLIIMTSGYPLPTINTIDLNNFTATTVNSQAVGLVIDGVSGEFILDPSLFNIMSSLSNYTAITSLTNSEETFPLLSNFDIQTPVFTFTGDFFFQQQRDDTFKILSFNYTQTSIPFDLSCNFKSTLFDNGTTVDFDGVFFVEHLQDVPQLEDVVVACIDQNTVVADPSAPSFGGSNTILSFVSFGDTTGVGNFLQFTNNYGDFFGVGLPFLFIIILAAAFTGRSAPTGILIIGIAIGIMWAMGIIDVDPFMWGIIIVLIILGVLGGKKFL